MLSRRVDGVGARAIFSACPKCTEIRELGVEGSGNSRELLADALSLNFTSSTGILIRFKASRDAAHANYLTLIVRQQQVCEGSLVRRARAAERCHRPSWCLTHCCKPAAQ